MNTEMIRGGVESSTSKKKDPLARNEPSQEPSYPSSLEPLLIDCACRTALESQSGPVRYGGVIPDTSRRSRGLSCTGHPSRTPSRTAVVTFGPPVETKR